MNDILKMMSAISQGPAPKIARTKVNGLIVSTIDSFDQGPETAILDVEGSFPVERYDSVEAAEIGHERWVSHIEAGLTSIIKLGYGTSILPEEVSLTPFEEDHSFYIDDPADEIN